MRSASGPACAARKAGPSVTLPSRISSATLATTRMNLSYSPLPPPYKLVVFAPQLGEQPDFVLRHELQAVEVIAELVQLAQGSGERRLLGYQKGGGHAVELRGRVVLELAVGGDLALQRHHFLRVALDPRQHLEADRADRDQ